jgi:hypothetical protein
MQSYDITILIRQRDELDRQIATAQQSASQAYNSALHAIRDAALSWASDHALPVHESERKNVLTITLDRWLSVELGRHEERYGPSLAISTAGGIRADFGGRLPLPSPAALVAFLEGLRQQDQAETDPARSQS